jgi:hypothetical protein
MKFDPHIIPPLHRNMTTVLLNLFPWVDPSNPEDFFSNSVYASLQLAAGIRVVVVLNNPNGPFAQPYGTLRVPKLNEIHTFSIRDEAEAVGLVSYLLPGWLKNPLFKKPVFRFVGYHHIFSPKAIISPSGNAFMELTGLSEKLSCPAALYASLTEWKPVAEFTTRFNRQPNDMEETDMKSYARSRESFGSVAWALKILCQGNGDET